MEKLITNKLTIESSGIFDKNLKKRYELTFECKGVKEKKSILVIGLNPASNDISIRDQILLSLAILEKIPCCLGCFR